MTSRSVNSNHRQLVTALPSRRLNARVNFIISAAGILVTLRFSLKFSAIFSAHYGHPLKGLKIDLFSKEANERINLSASYNGRAQRINVSAPTPITTRGTIMVIFVSREMHKLLSTANGYSYASRFNEDEPTQEVDYCRSAS